MESNRAHELAARWSRDEDYGVTFAPDGQSFMANGTSAVVCTNYAEAVTAVEGGRIVGTFAGELVEREVMDGHDFAIVDDRYLVDAWPSLVLGRECRVVYDLWNPVDRTVVSRLYGDAPQWEERERMSDRFQWTRIAPTALTRILGRAA